MKSLCLFVLIALTSSITFAASPTLDDVRFYGNEKFSDAQLHQGLSRDAHTFFVTLHTPAQAVFAEQIQKRVALGYAASGYPEAIVEYELQGEEILLKILENAHYKKGNIDLVAYAEYLNDDDLKRLEYWLRNGSIDAEAKKEEYITFPEGDAANFADSWARDMAQTAHDYLLRLGLYVERTLVDVVPQEDGTAKLTIGWGTTPCRLKLSRINFEEVDGIAINEDTQELVRTKLKPFIERKIDYEMLYEFETALRQTFQFSYSRFDIEPNDDAENATFVIRAIEYKNAPDLDNLSESQRYGIEFAKAAVTKIQDKGEPISAHIQMSEINDEKKNLDIKLLLSPMATDTPRLLILLDTHEAPEPVIVAKIDALESTRLQAYAKIQGIAKHSDKQFNLSFGMGVNAKPSENPVSIWLNEVALLSKVDGSEFSLEENRGLTIASWTKDNQVLKAYFKDDGSLLQFEYLGSDGENTERILLNSDTAWVQDQLAKAKNNSLISFIDRHYENLPELITNKSLKRLLKGKHQIIAFTAACQSIAKKVTKAPHELESFHIPFEASNQQAQLFSTGLLINDILLRNLPDGSPFKNVILDFGYTIAKKPTLALEPLWERYSNGNVGTMELVTYATIFDRLNSSGSALLAEMAANSLDDFNEEQNNRVLNSVLGDVLNSFDRKSDVEALEMEISDAIVKGITSAIKENKDKLSEQFIRISHKDDSVATGRSASAYMQIYQQAADEGLIAATYALGNHYRLGYGTEVDSKKSHELYLKAAEAGHPGACHRLANSFLKGAGVEPSLENATKWFLKAAELGYANAQLEIGYHYEVGKGLEKNHDLAFHWYKEAANQGHPIAMTNLGLCYYFERGTDKSYSKAAKWFQKAAEAGHNKGQSWLANCYKEGTGVDKDIGKAFDWYHKAAEGGYSYAQVETGYRLQKGIGTEKNLSKAAYWYRKAAEGGNATGMSNIALCLLYEWGVDKDETAAFSWFTKAASKGHTHSIYWLARCYRYEIGTARNLTKAAELYQTAADTNRHNAAKQELGECYEFGHGLPVDYAKARELYESVLATDTELAARFSLARLYEYGLGVEQDPQAAFTLLDEAEIADKRDSECLKAALAKHYLFGIGTEADIAKANQLITEAVEKDCYFAYTLLGDTYRLGLGKDQDYSKALDWYRKAQNEYDPDSFHRIGLMHEQGLLSDATMDKALEYYRKAVTEGSHEARIALKRLALNPS